MVADIPTGSPIIGRVGLNGTTYSNQIKLNYCPPHIRDAEDSVLEGMLKRQECEPVDVKNVLLDERDPNHLLFMNGYRAMYELQRRHGDDYVLPLLGLRQPRTVFEKLMKAVFGKFPKND